MRITVELDRQFELLDGMTDPAEPVTIVIKKGDEVVFEDMLLDGLTLTSTRFTGRMPNRVLWSISGATAWRGEQVDGREALHRALLEYGKKG